MRYEHLHCFFKEEYRCPHIKKDLARIKTSWQKFRKIKEIFK